MLVLLQLKRLSKLLLGNHLYLFFLFFFNYYFCVVGQRLQNGIYGNDASSPAGGNRGLEGQAVRTGFGQIGKQASLDFGEFISLSLSCLFLVHKTAFI